MKIFIKKELLQNQLQKTLISNIRSTLPILNNILIEAKDGFLTTISTDLNTSIKYKQMLEIEKEGSIVLPGRKLIEIINSLEEEFITIKIDNLKAEIKGKNSIFHLVGLSYEEFPILKEVKFKKIFTIDSYSLQEMIKMVIFSASFDETNIPYCGVYLELDDNKIRMVTSDRYRLSVIEKEYKIEDKIDVIIPIRTIQEITKILRGIDENIKVCISDKEIGIETSNIVFTSRLLEGKFPDYRKVIEKDINSIKLNKDTFYSALKKVSVISRECVKLSFLKNKFILEGESEIGDVKEELDIEYKGNEFNISFNPKYIFDCLRNLTFSEIIFGVSYNIDKGIIKIDNTFNITYIIMPLRE